MDPISLNKLLPIIDAIETRQEESHIPTVTFHEIVAENSHAQDLSRRAKDILRVLEAMSLILPRDWGTLDLTADYIQFIAGWNEGNLLEMSQIFIQYPAYARFLNGLRELGHFPVPRRPQSKTERQEFNGQWRASAWKKRYNTTFVAFDTFRRWAIAVGQAYLSPFDGILYWGGNWDNERPLITNFRDVCWGTYRKAEKASGYANLGYIADEVCRHLHISFQVFESGLNQLVESEPGLFELSEATIRQELTREFPTITIRARREVSLERKAARLLDTEEDAGTQWFEQRFVEDGVRIRGRLVKLIRWEKPDDTSR